MKLSLTLTQTYMLALGSAVILGAGAFAYTQVGRAPAIDTLAVSTQPAVPEQTYAHGATVNLAFPKGGRIATVAVQQGQTVHKGEVLATLSAEDAQGAVMQAKAALDMATARYDSLTLELKNARAQQDILVQNAYRTLLSSGLQAVPDQDDAAAPIITGTYTCGEEGVYTIKPYRSNNSTTNYSFRLSGLETDVQNVEYNTTSPLGNCGLFIRFVPGFSSVTTWTVTIPNERSAAYVANKNAYDLAVATRDKTVSELAATLERNNSQTSSARAQIEAARGAYQAALGVYQTNVITAPTDGVVTFIDTDLKAGQVATMNKTMISIEAH